jgi:hypothetical protein
MKKQKSRKIQREATRDLIFMRLDQRHNLIIDCGSGSNHTQYKRGCTASCNEPMFFVRTLAPTLPSPIEVHLHQSEGRHRWRPTRGPYLDSADTCLKKGLTFFDDRGKIQEHFQLRSWPMNCHLGMICVLYRHSSSVLGLV